jgi:2'-5' RNA ligase
VSAPEPERNLRLFVAIELPDAVRDALAAAIDTLRANGVDEGLRWVRPEGIHVTLKFLGSTPPALVPEISAGLERAVSGVAAFELRPEGLGAFHGGRNLHFTRQYPRESYPTNIRVLWVGVACDTERLAGLAEHVEAELQPLGFPGEKRKFAAHLTLARVRDDADADARRRLSHALEPFVSESTQVVGRFRPELVPAFPSFRAERVSLMRSTLVRGGAHYDALATFPLQ